MNDEELGLTREWDKVFPHSNEVDHEKVTPYNRYSITLVADPCRSKGARGPLAVITVSGSSGAVEEQSNGPYAQTTAERGFLTLAFDPSYTGESSGAPRYMASPDINTEDFSAAVGCLSCRKDVDPEGVGIIGICGRGGTAINAMALDPRIRAMVASTMYDMSCTAAKGHFDKQDSAAARDFAYIRFAAQRTTDYHPGSYARVGEAIDPLPKDALALVRDHHDYYKTPRDYHLRSLNSNEGWNVVGAASFLNQPLLAYAGEVRILVPVVYGGRAHLRYMEGGVFAQLTGENKGLLIVPGASYTDLYGGGGRNAILFDRIIESSRASLA